MATGGKKVQITLDNRCYPDEAILATCYRFLEDVYVFLEKKSSSSFTTVSLSPKSKKDSERIVEEFKNELINNTLRYRISARNKETRDYIVKTALFFSQPKEVVDEFLFEDLEKTGGKQENWESDPLEIAIPWEEKYGKTTKKKQPQTKNKT